jgi:hypothetical protein
MDADKAEQLRRKREARIAYQLSSPLPTCHSIIETQAKVPGRRDQQYFLICMELDCGLKRVPEEADLPFHRKDKASLGVDSP